MSAGRHYLAPLLWALFAFGLGSVPDVPAPDWALPLDKLAHLLLYGVLGVLLGRAWRRAGERPGPPVLIALAVLAGALDELHQARVPGRSPEMADWLMDVVGAATGFALGAAMTRRRYTPTDD
ncbi:MAG TPA: VanZ family protein [Longimicrobiales bacterium]|nr:VanZ family protein [Longimicrobiales bacterium]